MTTAEGLHVQAFGAGPPVLLIQGVGVPGQGWAPQVEGLKDRFRFAWFDNRGVGESAPPRGELTIEGMAADALAVMDAQGWPTAHVAGHSMGGLIAQAVALAAPERVRSLALLDTFATGPQGATPDLSTMWIGIKMRVGPRSWRRRAAIRLVLPDDYIATRDYDELHAELAQVFGRDDMADTPAFAMKQVGAMRRFDPTPREAEIAHLPAFVLTAEGDRIAKPAFSVQLGHRFGVEPVILEGSGHACTVQHADEVNRLLAEHWDAVEAGRG